MAARLQQSDRTVHIYIDNSNLWIQGQKTSARAKNLKVELDPQWRFDVGKLQNVLTREFAYRYTGSNVCYEYNLYGSTPPPVDTVWNVIRSNNVNVNTFKRSKWTGQEKKVDAQLIADTTDRAAEDYYRGVEAEFVLVSGDSDMLPAVYKIVARGFRVHIWSWKNCLASEYRHQVVEGIQVHELDAHLSEIGFRETSFRIDRDIINPNSVVVLDPVPKVDVINDFCSGLGIPIYRYDQERADESGAVDLVIIPSVAMEADDWDYFIERSKKVLVPHGLTVLTHREYRGHHLKDSSQDELKISNRFAELQVPEGQDGHGDDKDIDDEEGNRDGSFTLVNRSLEKQKKRLKINEQKGHGRWEKDAAKTYGTKKAKKHDMCPFGDKCWRRDCFFAHKPEELICPTCNRAGHRIGTCLER
ncbi:hypothetical protein K458DRAFT_385905 [Lentithecium fluviatile CBS 122367]|uniref:NYN domain-containing protein n=1 Tax=Lentithecium fluviatile CBS 122367 TaxID=1168545 RepID=A0A6G1J979_9PLEO|nr:hypothetical protein K458DRAFT_385905 [Lentithecium fluviatile CBS 122367]